MLKKHYKTKTIKNVKEKPLKVYNAGADARLDKFSSRGSACVLKALVITGFDYAINNGLISP